MASIIIAIKESCQNVLIESSQASISVLKVFLEQGDQTLGRGELRHVTALFILMGVILSNGYKNSNVYNMVAPRKALPYEYVRDLLRENFTLYTRLSSIEFVEMKADPTLYLELMEAHGRYYINDELREQIMLGVSEVAAAK